MKKFICIIIMGILLVSFGSCDDKAIQDNAEEVEQVIEEVIPKEITFDEAKKYLEENFDKLAIDGSTSMIPLHQALEDLFSADAESIEHSKTVDAFELFIRGDNDILLGVDYSDELLEKAKTKGVKLAQKTITREAFVFLINKNNPVRSLTAEQIKAIYSGKITNWSEVGGDDEPIKAYQRNSDSGSQMRMVKFMGDTKLMETDVEYMSGMGYVVEMMSKYDEGKYSIAYNMYTFTEKQYINDEVILLDVDGVQPTDESIFDETYPLIIYNYIYYDENNASASEFAENLYVYLMSGEGQKLISDSGYVNLNEKYDRNRDVRLPDHGEYGELGPYSDIGFYNEISGEYYRPSADNKLLVFTDYCDYILHGTKYQDNEKARDYLELILNSDIPMRPSTADLYEPKGTITLQVWMDGSLDPDDFFNFKYNDIYYSSLTYYIDEDKYILAAISKDTFNDYLEHGYFKGFSTYTDEYIPDAAIEITQEDFKNLYLRSFEWVVYDWENEIELKFVQPFK